MRPTIRRTTVAGLAVATLALASACGSGGSSDDHAKDPSASSSAPSAEDSGAGKELAAGTTLNAADAKSVMSSAVAEMTSMKISGEMSLGSVGSIHMEGVEQTKPSVRAEIKETIGGQDMDVRMIGSNMYIQMPASAGLPGGKKWMSMNFGDLGSLTGMDTSALSDSLADPASSVTKYAKYITGGKYVGSESIDGTAAKHYAFTIDMKGAIGELMPSGAPSSVAGSLPATITEDVWVDSDGHPVQIKADMGKLGSTTMHMSDFGTKVSVEAPPADEVADMKQMMSQLRGGVAQ